MPSQHRPSVDRHTEISVRVISCTVDRSALDPASHPESIQALPEALNRTGDKQGSLP